MEARRRMMVLRERKIDILRVLELQDEILELIMSRVGPAIRRQQSLPNDDDSYLAITAIVGALAEAALRVEERDLGALVLEVDRAWKRAITDTRH